jgi:hypothetical protein
MAQSSKAKELNMKDIDDLCLCGRDKLQEGVTELKIRVQNDLLAIKERACQGLRLVRRSLHLTRDIQANR